MEFSTCRDLADATLSAYHAPWKWKGTGKTPIQVAKILLKCFSDNRARDGNLTYVNPYTLLQNNPVESIRRHAIALGMTLPTSTLAQILDTIQARFNHSNNLNHAIHDAFTNVNRNHRYAHPSSFDDPSDTEAIKKLGSGIGEWCKEME